MTKFQEIDDNLEHKDSVIRLMVTDNLLKISQFIGVVREVFTGEGLQQINNKLYTKGGIGVDKKWFNEGVECELLQPNKNWRKGKIRFKISVEVCFEDDQTGENEAKSPLDELREIINQGE